MIPASSPPAHCQAPYPIQQVSYLALIDYIQAGCWEVITLRLLNPGLHVCHLQEVGGAALERGSPPARAAHHLPAANCRPAAAGPGLSAPCGSPHFQDWEAGNLGRWRARRSSLGTHLGAVLEAQLKLLALHCFELEIERHIGGRAGPSCRFANGGRAWPAARHTVRDGACTERA